jgi:outer membrane receptor for ferrienterochelin and colicin
MKTLNRTGAVLALAASLLLPFAITSPVYAAASDNDPGHIYVSVSGTKQTTRESIGTAAKIASETCNRPMNEMVRVAREVDGSGNRAIIACSTGNDESAAGVVVRFADVLTV